MKTFLRTVFARSGDDARQTFAEILADRSRRADRPFPPIVRTEVILVSGNLDNGCKAYIVRAFQEA